MGKVRFTFKVEELDDEGESVGTIFESSARAPVHALLKFALPVGAKKGLNNALILAGDAADNFNLLSYSFTDGKTTNFAFQHAEDAAQLGEQLRAVGATEATFHVWNKHHPEAQIPVSGEAVANDVADALSAMKGKPKTTITRKAKDGPA